MCFTGRRSTRTTGWRDISLAGGTMPSAELLLHFQVLAGLYAVCVQRQPVQSKVTSLQRPCRRSLIACFPSESGRSYCSAPAVAERFVLLQDDLAIQQQWFVNGKHYSRTLEAWLANMDAQKDSIMPIFQVLLNAALWNI